MVGGSPTTPTFVWPYKRFAGPWLLGLATRYVNEAKTTYRSAVRHEHCQIGYDPAKPITDRACVAAETPPAIDSHAVTVNAVNSGDTETREDASRDHHTLTDSATEEADPYHQAVIPPSLLWRFLGWLGGLTISLETAREMILKRNPNSTCHRVTGSVDPFKARSPERLQSLETARQLILITPEWEKYNGRPFFPQFATRAGFS